MALTLGEAKIKSLKLLDEYSINGKIITPVKNEDYLNKMNSLADMAQKEISQYRRIKATYEIVQYPIVNLVSTTPGFDSVKHLKTDIEFIGRGARSFYFEVNGLSTCYLEEKIDNVWTLLSLIVTENLKGFKGYPGTFEKFGVNNDVRLRFSGLYPYDIRNVALYEYPFPTHEDVPIFSTKVTYQMPENFVEVDKIIIENDSRQYGDLMDYYWEDKYKLIVDYRYQGRILIQYYREPTTITEATPDSYVFELDYGASNLVPYYISSLVKEDENPSISDRFRRIYETGLANLEPQAQEGIQIIQDIYNW